MTKGCAKGVGARHGRRPLHKTESTAGCGPVEASGTHRARLHSRLRASRKAGGKLGKARWRDELAATK